jgi:hypothetical protein
MELGLLAYFMIAAPVLGVGVAGIVSFISGAFNDANVASVAVQLRQSVAMRPLQWPGVVEIVTAPGSPLVVRLREREAPRNAPFVETRMNAERFEALLAPDGVVTKQLAKKPDIFDADDARAFVEEMLSVAHALCADIEPRGVSSGGSSIAIPV